MREPETNEVFRLFVNKSTCQNKRFNKMPSSKTSDVKAISKKASSFLKNRKNANVLLYLLSDADVSALTSFM